MPLTILDSNYVATYDYKYQTFEVFYLLIGYSKIDIIFALNFPLKIRAAFF